MGKEQEYVVEAIRDHQFRKGTIYYLIKWDGYPEEDNTWEPEENLSCDSLLKEYKKKHVYSINKQKSIAKIVGFKEGSTQQDIIYIVLFDGDTGFSEICSDTLKKWDIEKLIDFYEFILLMNKI